MLVIVDTLHKNTAGADENSSQDMGIAIGSATTIAMQTAAAVLLVHHTGHNGEHPRGASSLSQDVDFMARVVRNDREMRVLLAAGERTTK